MNTLFENYIEDILINHGLSFDDIGAGDGDIHLSIIENSINQGEECQYQIHGSYCDTHVHMGTITKEMAYDNDIEYIVISSKTSNKV